jgi:hypothetical protein
MKTYTEEQLQEILQKHKLWIDGEDGGERADLRYADLRYVDLSYADWRYADLSYADLRHASLSCSGLSNAKLHSADLSYADLSCSDLSYADLSHAKLRSADLSRADLSCSDLSYADLRDACLLATGNMVNVKSANADIWHIAYTHDILQIGCQRHPIAEWWAFDDKEIELMDGRASAWWAVWKPILQAMIAGSPAQPTGFIEGDEQ